MNAIESKTAEFRESALLRELLAQLPQECRRMIALASIYEIPVDRQAVAAAVGDPIDPYLDRSVSLGLVEGGTDPATGQSRHFVSRILLPLIGTETTEEEKIEASRRAATYLYQTQWISGSFVGFDEALEIFRLAMAAREREIVVEIADRAATTWVNTSRFREAESICRTSLALGKNYRLLLQLARAQAVLGEASEAQRNYEEALALCPDSDIGKKSAILFNFAALLSQQGDVERALEFWQQQLPLYEQFEESGAVQARASALSR
jgi:tetratricopeptide (TPR) repeat protein